MNGTVLSLNLSLCLSLGWYTLRNTLFPPLLLPRQRRRGLGLFPSNSLLQHTHLGLDCIIYSLQLAYLLEGLVDVGLFQFAVQALYLGHILVGLSQGGQRRGLQPSPFRVWRQTAIGFRTWGVVFLLELIPQQVEEELLQRLGP